MPNIRRPRHGSMQFWPRKRAKKECPRVRSWADSKEAKALGFAGFKVGMTHVLYTDNRKHSQTKGEDIICPVTVIECPPLKVAAIKFYKKDSYGMHLKAQINAKQVDKLLSRKMVVPKKVDEAKVNSIKPEDYSDITLLAYTQPWLTGIGAKKPRVIEVGLGGSVQEKFDYGKEKLGKEIAINDVFGEGDLVDFHGVTKGKGTQGPVKRFGVKIRGRKSEKTKRGPGSLGPWKGQGHVMYRIAYAGQMGYQTRTEYNKWVVKIGDKPEDINPKGGFLKYGLVKNNYLLVKGGVSGARKRTVRLCAAIRPNKKLAVDAPEIQHVDLESKQGR